MVVLEPHQVLPDQASQEPVVEVVEMKIRLLVARLALAVAVWAHTHHGPQGQEP
jgi:hypothetical protein